jgi:hypothetical protein
VPASEQIAAPAIHHGFPENQAYYLGKVLECASFCAEPYGGKETVLKKNDSCVIGSNESREIVNRGNEVCTIFVAVAAPPA